MILCVNLCVKQTVGNSCHDSISTWKCDAGKYVYVVLYCGSTLWNPYCANCPSGKTSNGCGDHISCRNCYNANSCTANSCSNVPSSCSVGKYLRSAHRRVCVNCDAGTFKDTTSTDAEACQDCPAGKYNQHTGRSVCEACPHMHSSPVASSSSDDCFPCSDGLFADENNLCVSCPDNYILNVDGTCPCISDGKSRLLCFSLAEGLGRRVAKRWRLIAVAVSLAKDYAAR